MEEKYSDSQSQNDFPSNVIKGHGIGPEGLGNAMLDRDLWKTIVENIPASRAEG